MNYFKHEIGLGRAEGMLRGKETPKPSANFPTIRRGRLKENLAEGGVLGC